MLIDLLAQDNYISFNSNLAKILGLHSAIYLSEIMNINSKAIKKNKIKDNCFTIDKKYIEERTTISIKEQEDIENNLIKIGILEKNEEKGVLLNITVLTSILMNPDEKLITNLKLSTKKKTTKAEAISNNLKGNILCKNQELRDAYEDWIDSVIAKQGWMSKTSVISAQNKIDEFTEKNLDLALKIIEIASINGYRDMSWAIENYKSNYLVNFKPYPINNKKQDIKVSEEVF